MQHQLELPTDTKYPAQLVSLLSEDLDFHGRDNGAASHNFHSFPAKFPPQLPRAFILELTQPGDVVLDPMMGSGTTVLESYLAGRYAVGFDIDPLALLLTKVKVTPVDARTAAQVGREVVEKARARVEDQAAELEAELAVRWDRSTKEFVDYWFTPQVQTELLALITEIEQVENEAIQDFLKLAFSSIIITKSGGVSLAFDLAHTRPHKAKRVFDAEGNIIVGQELANDTSRRVKVLTKRLRSPLDEFTKRLSKNLEGVLPFVPGRVAPTVQRADAQQMPLDDNSIDLIVTSPPYASNAIDYMRAHKFSLVWMDHAVGNLSEQRRAYIGGEYTTGIEIEELPKTTKAIVEAVAAKDPKKGLVLARYYSEMKRVLREMLRVLSPGKAAIVVVGNSTLRGIDIQIHACLADIGQDLGFLVPKIGTRNLDRNRRMLPAGMSIDLDSQIQQRMHEEYVIGFLKP